MVIKKAIAQNDHDHRTDWIWNGNPRFSVSIGVSWDERAPSYYDGATSPFSLYFSSAVPGFFAADVEEKNRVIYPQPTFYGNFESFPLRTAQNTIRAQAAFSRDLRGAGQNLAIFGTGFDLYHDDLQHIDWQEGYDYWQFDTMPGDDFFPANGIGTASVSLLAGHQEKGGLAPDITITPYRLSPGPPQWADATHQALALDNNIIFHAILDPLPVEQVTLDSYLQTIGDSYMQIANQGGAIITPAGDTALIRPDLSHHPIGTGFLPFIQPGHEIYQLYDSSDPLADYGDLAESLITVVAVDEKQQLADFSHACGVSAAWCLAAPGTDLSVSLPSYMEEEGAGQRSSTILAAAQVAGALALVAEAYPRLSSLDHTRILLYSAEDLTPDDGYDADGIYGHGLLDIESALTPEPPFYLPLTADRYGPGLVVDDSAVFVGKLVSELESSWRNQIMIFDELGRYFDMHLQDFVDFSEYTPLYDILSALDQPPSLSSKIQPEADHNFFMSWQDEQHAMDYESLQIFYSQSLEGGAEQFLYFGKTPVDTYRAMSVYSSGNTGDHRLAVQDSIFTEKWRHPYLALIDYGHLYVKTTPHAFYTQQTIQLAGQTARNGGGFGQFLSRRYYTNFHSLSLSFEVGTLSETNSFLGIAGQGIFDMAPLSFTTFMGGSLHFSPDPTEALDIFWYRGYSNVIPTQPSLVSQDFSLESQAIGAFYSRQNLWFYGDLFSLSYQQDLQIVAGGLPVRLPTGYDEGQGIIQQDMDLPLTSEGRSQRLRLSYQIPVATYGEIGMVTEWNSYGQREHSDQWMAMLQLSLRW